MRIEDYYYIDGNYFAKWKYTYEDALEISKTLINCTECIDCQNCTNCVGCVGCKNCTDCVECTWCEDCSNCLDCHYCYECEKIERCFNRSEHKSSKNLRLS